MLRGAASFFQASDSVNRDTFHAYVSGLDLTRHFPAIDNINFAQYVTARQWPAFERSLRAEGHAGGYPLMPLTPPGKRPDYSILTMIEPLAPFAALRFAQLQRVAESDDRAFVGKAAFVVQND